MTTIRVDDFVTLPWGSSSLVARVLEINGFGAMQSALLCVSPDEHGPGTHGDTVRYLLSEIATAEMDHFDEATGLHHISVGDSFEASLNSDIIDDDEELLAVLKKSRSKNR